MKIVYVNNICKHNSIHDCVAVILHTVKNELETHWYANTGKANYHLVSKVPVATRMFLNGIASISMSLS